VCSFLLDIYLSSQSAYVPLYSSDSKHVRHALLLRCQDNVKPSDPYSVGPSYMALAVEDASFPSGSQRFVPVKRSDVVINATLPYENFGTEDPRIVYDAATGVYTLLYSAVASDSGGLTSRLALATTRDPRNISAWTKHGPIIANNDKPDPKNPLSPYSWSKSGALLQAPAGQKSLLIFGDSTIEPGMQTAAPSDDFLSYKYNSTIFIHVRDNKTHFDSALCEAGPAPLPLGTSQANESDAASSTPPFYFFLYNSARGGFPSAKPGWDLQYNVGFALLDGPDPATILLRSEQPILSPELGWETGVKPWLGLTPNVVFVEGARLATHDDVHTASESRVRRADGSTVDKIVAWYGAADSTTGAFTVTVEYTPVTAEEAAQEARPHHDKQSSALE